MSEKMFNLEEFAGGALSEQFNTEAQKIIENIADPNTDPTKVRKLTITAAFKANSNRNMVITSIEVKPGLAPVKAFETSLMLDKDIQTGKVMAAEINNQIPGQEEMEIENTENQANDGKILDLRKQAK